VNLDIPKHKKLILFDGLCNLCNSSVLYVIKRDKKNIFLFAPLQSEIGKQIIQKFNINTEIVDSIILYIPKKDGLSQKSTAALKIAWHLGFPQNLFTVFFIVPTSIRNWVYDVVARNRYQWFGKSDNCMVPTPNLQSKFLN
jgi:predicted DCC family thiol-disulfide oxidoreductase YuxK